MHVVFWSLDGQYVATVYVCDIYMLLNGVITT